MSQIIERLKNKKEHCSIELHGSVIESEFYKSYITAYKVHNGWLYTQTEIKITGS
jgi:hypothetical protein